jgi:hypothetical protein
VDAFPGTGHMKPAEEELRSLRRELEEVRQERDILKKAMAIRGGRVCLDSFSQFISGELPVVMPLPVPSVG